MKSRQFLQIDKVIPIRVVALPDERANKGSPAWALGLADQVHVSLMRESVGFARVTLNTRGHNIFPRSAATAIPWDNVIHIQMARLKVVAAVLAAVIVALEEIFPGKSNFLHRQLIVATQE